MLENIKSEKLALQLTYAIILAAVETYKEVLFLEEIAKYFYLALGFFSQYLFQTVKLSQGFT